jgi:hypothetical protein
MSTRRGANLMSQHEDHEFLCAGCGRQLVAGSGNFYVIRIEALADPTPPRFSAEDLRRDVHAEWERLTREMRFLSAQEALDQVYRELLFYLCTPCYRQWIAQPVK